MPVLLEADKKLVRTSILQGIQVDRNSSISRLSSRQFSETVHCFSLDSWPTVVPISGFHPVNREMLTLEARQKKRRKHPNRPAAESDMEI